MVIFLIRAGDPSSGKFNTILLSFHAAPSTCRIMLKGYYVIRLNLCICDRRTCNEVTMALVVFILCSVCERVDINSSSQVDVSSSLIGKKM